MRQPPVPLSWQKAYSRDEKRVFPAAVYCSGEYGYKDLFIGVPVVLGSDGVEKILEVNLQSDEKASLDKSAEAVAELKRSPHQARVLV